MASSTESHEIELVLGPDALETLLDEIRLYLEAVEAFRREGASRGGGTRARRAEVLR